jgi:ADP-heptose:LPS heptosyltransferase
MRPQTIRFLDYWIGVPACALLSALCRVSAFAKGHARPPRRILFLKFIEQGATVLAQDAIGRAAARVGRENIFFCVFESNRAILDVLGTVPPENILCLRDRRLTTFVVDFLRGLAWLRGRGVDTVIDMEFFSRASAIFAYLSGASTRVGLHRFTGELPYRGNLMTHRVQYNPHHHVSVQYSVLVESAFVGVRDEPLLKVPVEAIAGSTAPATPVFTATAAELAKARQLAGSGEAGPLILLNPNASDLLPLRKWDSSKFIELARQLLDRYPSARIALTGAAAERDAAEVMCRTIGSPRVVSVAGQTSLRELLALYSIASVMVTNDSGPAHFASLTPIHTVVLFGPETPRLFRSLSPSTTVIWKELACSPCVSVFNHRLSPCRNNVCMQAITVSEVFDAVGAALAARGFSAAARPAVAPVAGTRTTPAP